MTISTRNAFAAINGMFQACDRGRGGCLFHMCSHWAGGVWGGYQKCWLVCVRAIAKLLLGGLAICKEEHACASCLVPCRRSACICQAVCRLPPAMAAAPLPLSGPSCAQCSSKLHYLFLQGSLPAEHAALPPHPHLEPTLHGVGSGGFGSGAFGSGNFGSGAFGSSNFGSGNFGSGSYEPTMTLATRSAFAAINKMFKVSWVWLLSGVCVCVIKRPCCRICGGIIMV